jgi:hypothetical protein
MVVVLGCSISHAEETVEIPLSEIWALDMPRTKNIRELEPNRDSFKEMSAAERIQNSLVENTRWLLNINNRPEYGSVADHGFVVAATELEALKEANLILAGKHSRQVIFDESDDLTLVFFAYQNGKHIRLNEISLRGKEVSVEYQFGSPKFSASIVLIPLGKLSPGTRHVSFKRHESDKPDAELRQHRKTLERQIVCDSFTFGVRQ